MGKKIKPVPHNTVQDSKYRDAYLDSLKNVRVATSNLFMDKKEVPVDPMVALMFEDYGAIELSNLSRSDSMNGLDISYQAISNIGNLAVKYSPKTMLKLGTTILDTFNNYQIELFDYVPSSGNGPNELNVYISSNSLVIEFVNIKNEKVEVEFIKPGTIINGILYS